MMRRASTRAWRNACCAPRRKNRGYDDALSYYSSIRVVGKCVLPKAFVQGGKDAAAAADAFEGQESIDVTREETDGETSVGQTGAVTSVQPGGLLVLEGLRSSVQLGSVLRFPGLQAKAVLLAHREPKSFAMLATKLGGVHVPDSDNVAEIKVGDALEVEKVDEERSHALDVHAQGTSLRSA